MTWFEYHNAGNSEQQQQQALSFLLAQSVPGKAVTGVLSGLAVTQTATASGSVVVTAGAAAVQAATLDGAQLVGDVQDTTLSVLTGSPMGSVPRNDLVVADRATGSIRALIGSPNVTPTDPTVPTSAVPLARIRNAANATTIPTSAIDDLRVFTTLNVPQQKLTRVLMPLQGDQANAPSITTANGASPVVPAAWLVSPSGMVSGTGAFTYTTPRGAGTSFTNASACIPASVRAKTDRGLIPFTTTGNLGDGYYGTIRHDINPYTGEWVIYRSDIGSFTWVGGKSRITLAGIGWDMS